MKIYLEKYNWFYKDNIRVTGYILEAEKIIRDIDLIDYFSRINTIIEFENRLIEANGQFSVIIERKDEIWIACDRARNYPLFYTCENDELIISDNCYNCLKIKGFPHINNIAANAFLAAGYVPNNLTLIDDIYQVEAGSIVVFGNKISSKFYHNCAKIPVIDIDIDTAERSLRDLLESVFSNHLNVMKDKFIAVSLSGGYDSRLIALMAKKYHPENLLCFTYGRKNNPEASRAQRVAKIIGVDWINIEYNSDLIKGFINDKVFQLYFPFASDFSSMFYMQDYFAVKYLKENKVVPESCAFIPGHSGDTIAGSHLSYSMNKALSDNDLVEKIYSNHFIHVRIPDDQKSLIHCLIKEKIPSSNPHAWKTYENWIMKERQAKFIVNSTKVYLYFGDDYIMPFWDKHLIDFFSALPFRMKLNKQLYDNVLKKSFFNEQGLNFNDDIHIGFFTRLFHYFMNSIKPLLPYSLVTLLTDQKNIVLYDEITKELREDMGNENVIRPIQANFYNSYLIQWYLFRTRELVNSLK